MLGASQVEYKPFGKPPLKREPNHIPNLDFRAGHLVFALRRCCAEHLCHFGVRGGEVRRTCVVACFLPLIWLKSQHCSGFRKVPENSASKPRAGVQSRQRRLQRGPRLLLLFDALCALHLYSRPATDKLLHIGSGAARRALVISDFPIFPPPVPRDVALEPAQGKLSPLCARGRGAKSRADFAHLFQDFLRVHFRACMQGVGLPRARRPAAY